MCVEEEGHVGEEGKREREQQREVKGRISESGEERVKYRGWKWQGREPRRESRGRETLRVGSTVYGLRSTVYSLLVTVDGRRSTVYGLGSQSRGRVYVLWSTVYGLRSTSRVKGQERERRSAGVESRVRTRVCHALSRVALAPPTRLPESHAASAKRGSRLRFGTSGHDTSRRRAPRVTLRLGHSLWHRTGAPRQGTFASDLGLR
eukprot:3412738-Rhodomonas_salina.1